MRNFKEIFGMVLPIAVVTIIVLVLGVNTGQAGCGYGGTASYYRSSYYAPTTSYYFRSPQPIVQYYYAPAPLIYTPPAAITYAPAPVYAPAPAPTAYYTAPPAQPQQGVVQQPQAAYTAPYTAAPTTAYYTQAETATAYTQPAVGVTTGYSGTLVERIEAPRRVYVERERFVDRPVHNVEHERTAEHDHRGLLPLRATHTTTTHVNTGPAQLNIRTRGY